ncbi:MAG: CinA family protein [Desulfonauticus sp.]|nr:CinA family protein [Desulfonauticus sp.]
MQDIVFRLAEILKSKGYWLSVAESCTGGLLAHTVTNVSGSSLWFKGGIVAYANEIKERLLGVDREILIQYGAVSQQCVLAMVQGLIKLFKTEVGVAISGIAGPGGGSEEKPVGTVYQAFWLNGQIWSKKCLFAGERLEIKEQSVEFCLKELLTKFRNTKFNSLKR